MFYFKVAAECNKDIEGFNAKPMEFTNEYKPSKIKRILKEEYLQLLRKYKDSDIEIILSGNLKIENEDGHEDKDITKTVAITSSAYNIKDGEEWNIKQIDMFVNLLRNQVMMHSNYDMEANM